MKNLIIEDGNGNPLEIENIRQVVQKLSLRENFIISTDESGLKAIDKAKKEIGFDENIQYTQMSVLGIIIICSGEIKDEVYRKHIKKIEELVKNQPESIVNEG